MKRFLTAVLIVAWAGVWAGPHPNMFINQQEIDAVNAKVSAGQQPWKSAYSAMISRANSALSKGKRSVVDNGGPCAGSVHGFSTDGTKDGKWGDRGDYTTASDISQAMVDLGLGYAFTKQAKYADKAIELLYHWMVNPATYMFPMNTNFSPATCGWGTQWSIEIMVTIPGMLYAADLVWSYPGWKQADKDAIRAWAQRIGDHAKIQDQSFYNNGENWRLSLMAAAGALVDDEAMLTHAFNRHKFDWDGIEHNGKTGQILVDGSCNGCGFLTWEVVRTTSLNYSTYALNGMTQVAEIARHRGVDLYSYKNAKGWGLELVLDKHAPYVANPSSWPYQQTSSYSGANAALYELAYNWKQKSSYMSAINKWGRPMNCIRNMRSHTLTHGAGAYTWKIWPAPNGTGIIGAQAGAAGPGVMVSPKPMQDRVSFRTDGTKLQGNTCLTIYNETGQEVCRVMRKGISGTLEWNGITGNNRAADPGVYFYHLTNGNQSTTGRIIKVR